VAQKKVSSGCQRLGALPEKLRRGATQDQEPGVSPLPVRQHPQHREQVGTALHLVDHDQAGKLAQRLLVRVVR
jgi:hypothetical protein